MCLQKRTFLAVESKVKHSKSTTDLLLVLFYLYQAAYYWFQLKGIAVMWARLIAYVIIKNELQMWRTHAWKNTLHFLLFDNFEWTLRT